MKLIKIHTLVAANGISILFGISLIVTGAIKWIENIFKVFQQDLKNSQEWCIFLGSFTVGNSLLGIVALFTSGKPTRWLRCLHYSSTFIIICSLIACADMSTHIQQSLEEQVKINYAEYIIFKSEVEKIQRTLQCCGFTSQTDPEVQQGNLLIESCCPEKVSECTKSEAYESNCSSKILLICPFSRTITVLALLTAFSLIALLIGILIAKCEPKITRQENTVTDDLMEDLDFTEFAGSIAPSHTERHALYTQ